MVHLLLPPPRRRTRAAHAPPAPGDERPYGAAEEDEQGGPICDGHEEQDEQVDPLGAARRGDGVDAVQSLSAGDRPHLPHGERRAEVLVLQKPLREQRRPRKVSRGRTNAGGGRRR